ncbi:hypothetical protein VP01_4861g1 [Puccinia sorghi]|uniref:Uncharacterized protein n=1 Tax=Puccinia sorghi TaxID=27349 RepID=A0A0L6UMB7_9BASI|nr:hypothetical protein VP01_4861g1 [Puccinia sorghi]
MKQKSQHPKTPEGYALPELTVRPSELDQLVQVLAGEPGLDLETRDELILNLLNNEPWDMGEFFKKLTIIFQYCNNPMFSLGVIPVNHGWQWPDLGKVVHLVEHVKDFLNGDCGIQRPKAVIFLS